jgi:DNA repair protein RadC
MSILFEIQTIKRIKNSEKIKIVSPKDVYNIKQIQDIKDATQENLIVITLNRKNIVTTIELVALGRANNINIDVKDIVRPAIIQASLGIILVHNHPSGDTKPSKQDIDFSIRIGELSSIFNIKLLDHIIVGEGYLSLKELGCLEYSGYKDMENITNGAIKELKNENSKLIEELNKKEKKISVLENQVKKYSKQIFLDNEIEA